MVICGSYIFEFIFSKDMEKIYNKEIDSMESSHIFMSNTNC